MNKLSLNDMLSLGILDELAKVCDSRGKSMRLLILADYPLHLVPPFKASYEFWFAIIMEIHNGVPPGDFQKLLEAGLKLYPKNKKFAENTSILKKPINSLDDPNLTDLANFIKRWIEEALGYLPAESFKFWEIELRKKKQLLAELIFETKEPPSYQTDSKTLIWVLISNVEEEEIVEFHKTFTKGEFYEGWLVTKGAIRPNAIEKLRSLKSRIDAFNVDDFLHRNIRWENYFSLIKKEFKEKIPNQYFMQPTASVDYFDFQNLGNNHVNSVNLEQYLNRWLNENTSNQISILGEFGTGKTSFLLYYTNQLVKEFQQNRDKGKPHTRIPIYIPLNEFYNSGLIDPDNLMSFFCGPKYRLGIGFNIFKHLNKEGKLLFLLDGFDEMALKMTEDQLEHNFEKITKLISNNSKVILSCRTEHFFHREQERSILQAEKPKGQELPHSSVLYLNKLSNAQIRDFIYARHGDQKMAENIMANRILLRLAHRPLLIDLMLESVTQLRDTTDHISNLSGIFFHAIYRKLEADGLFKLALLPIEDRFYFLMMLAWKFYTENRSSIEFKDIPAFILEVFQDRRQYLEKHLISYQFHIHEKTLLVRKDDLGYFTFAHHSFVDFFVAVKLAIDLGFGDTASPSDPGFPPPPNPIDDDDINSGGGDSSPIPIDQERESAGIIRELLQGFKQKNKADLYTKKVKSSFFDKNLNKEKQIHITDFKKRILSPVIAEFVKELVPDSILWDIVESTRNHPIDEVQYAGGNAASILAIQGARFSQKNLSGVNMAGTRLLSTNLSETNFSNAYFVEANISGSNLSRANFTGADLRKVKAIDMSNIYALSMHPKANLSLSGGSDAIVRLWNSSNEHWDQIDPLNVEKRTSIQTIKWSPCGGFFIGGTDDKGVISWNYPDLRKIDLGNLIQGVVHSIDILGEEQPGKSMISTYIAIGGDRAMMLRADVLQDLLQLMGEPKEYKQVLEKKLKKLIAHEFKGYGKILNLAFSPQGEFFAITQDSDIILFDGKPNFQEKFILKGHNNFVKQMHFHPRVPNKLFSASTITSKADNIHAWNIMEKKGELSLIFDESHQVNKFNLSPDGKFLVGGLGTGQIGVWDTETGARRTAFIQAHEHLVRDVCLYQRDQLYLATASDDGLIKIWNFEKILNEKKDNFITSIAIKMECTGANLTEAILDSKLKAFLEERGAHWKK